MDMRLKIETGIFLLFTSCLAWAQEDPPSFSPASFPDDLAQTTSRIEFPARDGNFRLLAFCGQQLKKNGKFAGNNSCWPGHLSIDARIQRNIFDTPGFVRSEALEP